MRYDPDIKTKEVHTMNAVHTYRPVPKAYPNAADRSYFMNKLADTFLSAAICVGIVTIIFFLITMI